MMLHRCSPWRVELPFETFAHAHTLTLPPPFTQPPSQPPPLKKKKKKKIVRLGDPCQFIEKSPPPPPPTHTKNGFFVKKIHLPLPPPPRPHTPPPFPPTPPNPHPAQFFSDLDIRIICQLDSVLVNFFYKLTNNPNLFLFSFFGWGGGGEWT